MGVLTNLNSGSLIQFEEEDMDVWGYNGSILQQYYTGSLTENELPVINLNENYITLDWGNGSTSTLYDGDFIWVEP
jgi:hypothetical protein